jgi:hypothetical protein
MKADENLRRDLIAAWEDAETLEDALVAIQQVIEKYQPALTKIEDRQWDGSAKNVYYHPAACGLELLATAEEDEAWQFNYVCLWRDLESGRFFMGQDAGCSCPSPFEDFRSVSDLTEVKTRKEAKDYLVFAGGDYTPSSLSALLTKIGEVMSRW